MITNSGLKAISFTAFIAGVRSRTKASKQLTIRKGRFKLTTLLTLFFLFGFIVAISSPGQAPQLNLVAELTIGQEGGDENLTFGQMATVDVDAAGHIYILDSYHEKYSIKIFDRTGRFLRKIDIPKGQGPQEMTQVYGLAVTPSGRLFINGDWKMIVYDSQGNYLRTFKVDFEVSCIRSAGTEEIIGIGPHAGKILHVFDSAGRLLSSFGEVLEVPQKFEPMKMMPMFGAPILFSCSKDGRIFVLNPHRYEVLIFKDKKLLTSLKGSSDIFEPLTQKGRGFVSTAAIILPAGKYLLVYFDSFKNRDQIADLFLDGKQVGSLKLPGKLKACDYQGKLYLVSEVDYPTLTRYSVSEK